MSIYRKLKEYIEKRDISINSIFGSLMSRQNKFSYKTKEGQWCLYEPCGIYDGSQDFLLEYYVMGIVPEYEIKNNKIIPYLYITLQEELEEEDY